MQIGTAELHMSHLLYVYYSPTVDAVTLHGYLNRSSYLYSFLCLRSGLVYLYNVFYSSTLLFTPTVMFNVSTVPFLHLYRL